MIRHRSKVQLRWVRNRNTWCLILTWVIPLSHNPISELRECINFCWFKVFILLYRRIYETSEKIVFCSFESKNNKYYCRWNYIKTSQSIGTILLWILEVRSKTFHTTKFTNQSVDYHIFAIPPCAKSASAAFCEGLPCTQTAPLFHIPFSLRKRFEGRIVWHIIVPFVTNTARIISSSATLRLCRRTLLEETPFGYERVSNSTLFQDFEPKLKKGDLSQSPIIKNITGIEFPVNLFF